MFEKWHYGKFSVIFILLSHGKFMLLLHGNVRDWMSFRLHGTQNFSMDYFNVTLLKYLCINAETKLFSILENISFQPFWDFDRNFRLKNIYLFSWLSIGIKNDENQDIKDWMVEDFSRA